MAPLSSAQQRADIALAAVLFVGALLSAVLSAVAGIYGAEQADLAWAVAYAFVLAVPLALRRRWPATVAVVVSVAYFAAVTLRVPELYAGNIAMFIALYTVGAWSENRRRAMIVRVAIIAAMFVWLTVIMYQDATLPADQLEDGGMSRVGAFSPYVAYSLLMLLINVLYFAGAYYFGERAFAQRTARSALEERTAELEREREVTAAQAVALDRVRIARELHDVVAHHVSLMGVQAGAARAVMAADPAQAGGILEGVESSARDALGELRHLLETLRTPDAGPDTGSAPYGLAALPALVEEADAAGLATTLTVVGEPSAVPDLVQLNLFRIAQEALTNARRHAGPDATADVRVRYGAGAIELEVSNTGRVGPARPGLGQVGMRERAAASGGTIEMGPRPRGSGYLVRTRIPLPERTVADA
ncbi:sensor histidine kinase [Microbacterium sp. RD1]|uniref:sensor histidine kinase n=1 Tax=Microbacterium sp. RD1 TaxID=3457313 RepID=UPI003FA58A5C